MYSDLKCPGPSGEWIEELTEKPQHVSVHVLSSTTALMSWTSSQENYNGTIVSVVSLTCQKQKESQRLEKQYCTQVKEGKGRHWSAGVGLPHPLQPSFPGKARGAVLRSPRCIIVDRVTESQEIRAQASSITVASLLPLPFTFIPHSREFIEYLLCAGYCDGCRGPREFVSVLLLQRLQSRGYNLVRTMVK